MITPLRKLAAEHAAGRIGDAEFRQRRRELLQRLAARDQSTIIAPGPPTVSEARTRARFREVGLGWLILIALALGLQWQHRDAREVEPGPLERGARIVINGSDWGSAELERLQTQWDALSPAQRLHVRESPWYPKLIDALTLRVQTLQQGPEPWHPATAVQTVRLERLLTALEGHQEDTGEP